MRFALVCLSLVIVACEGPAGPAGPGGPAGSDGDTGSQGSQGSQGSAGSANPAPWLTQPDVQIAVSGLTFDASGAHVAFTLADGKGTALDRTGTLTDGPVAVSFVLAQLAANPDGSAGQYTAYTTRTVSKQYPTPDSSVTATQATTESVAASFDTIDVAAGSYRYNFVAPLTGLDTSLTQTVLAVAVRSASTGTTIDRTTLSARPDAGATIKREVVTAAACDSCHASFAMHGGRYTSTEQCVMCHQPQSTDPDSGNTVDFKVMVHKIHRGSDLVNKPYQIIGFMGAVADFSTVEFPASSAAHSISNCTMCHAANAAQADRYATGISKQACTSCHDSIEFDTLTPTPPMVLHSGGTQPDTAQCNVCHPQTGSLAGVFDKHFVGTLAPNATQVRFAIQSVIGTTGQAPVITFSATVNGAPVTNLTATGPLTRLTFTIAGPNTDEEFAYQARAVGTSGTIGTLAAFDAPNGVYQYTFPATGCSNIVADGIFPTTGSCLLPAAASYRAGAEGYLQATGGPRYAAPNATLVFPTGALDRRQIVDVSKCNGCHSSLAAHGGSRNDPKYCTMCHNTTLENVRTTLTQGGMWLAFTLDFRSMIHKIHQGENLANGFVIGTSDFSDVRYPRSTTDCSACHTSKNWTLPLPATYSPSLQSLFSCPDSPVTPGATCSVQPTATATVAQAPFTLQPLPPQSSVCTSCHDADYTVAHAQLNTTPAGVEACAACHGPGMAFDVSAFHGSP